MSLKDEPLELAEALLDAYATQISGFLAAANQFCNSVEARESFTQVGFLQVVEGGLAGLYTTAMALPDPDLWWDDDDEEPDVVDALETDPGSEISAEELKVSGERFRQQEQDEFPILSTSRVTVSQEMELAGQIRALLGDHDLYQEVFNPYGKAEAIHASLSEDISSIYGSIKTYLPLYAAGDIAAQREAVWNWRFGFDGHWGEHLTGCLRALHTLLRDQRSFWDEAAWDRGKLVRSGEEHMQW
jgi:Domain of unknown function (DUF5063)